MRGQGALSSIDLRGKTLADDLTVKTALLLEPPLQGEPGRSSDFE
jgi:hypothetical protein